MRPEEPDEFRTAFERDRDRILHSKAFRRLKHKTQVFINPEGDHYVTRLTHTLQVTQIARALAAALSLNEPLAEAIALGHDVGHSPFGHTGEEALSPVLPDRRLAPRGAERAHLRGARGPQPDLGGARRHPRPLLEDRRRRRPRRRRCACATRDRIAYLTHDALDALRAGVPDPGRFPALARWSASGSPARLWIDEMINAVIDESLRPATTSTWTRRRST